MTSSKFTKFLLIWSTESWETQHLKARKHKPKFEFRTLIITDKYHHRVAHLHVHTGFSKSSIPKNVFSQNLGIELMSNHVHSSLTLHCKINVQAKGLISNRSIHDVSRSIWGRWFLHRTVRHDPQAAVLPVPAHNTALICDTRDRQGPGHCRLQPGHLRVRIQLSSARLKLCWRRSLTSYDVLLAGRKTIRDWWQWMRCEEKQKKIKLLWCSLPRVSLLLPFCT